jgi:hypothetical protein
MLAIRSGDPQQQTDAESCSLHPGRSSRSSSGIRDRQDDIPELVNHFVDTFSRRIGKQIDSIPPQTIAAFKSYSWPGIYVSYRT